MSTGDAPEHLVARFTQDETLVAKGEELYKGVARGTDSMVGLVLVALGMLSLVAGFGVWAALFLGPASLLWLGILGIRIPGLNANTVPAPGLVICTIDEERLLFDTGRARQEVLWRRVGQAIESDDLFFLRYRSNAWRVIPKSAFQNADDLAVFRGIASRKVALRRVPEPSERD